jgi:hypothetical protein
MDSYLLVPTHWYSTIDQPHRSHTRDTLLATVRDLLPGEIEALNNRARDARFRLGSGLFFALLSFAYEPLAAALIPPSNPHAGLVHLASTVVSWFCLIGGGIIFLAYAVILVALESTKRQFATVLAQVSAGGDSTTAAITWLLDEDLIEVDR